MGLIGWLWNNTVSPEAQEVCMIQHHEIQTRWQRQSVQRWESVEDIDPEAWRKEIGGIMQERNRVRTELAAHGYSYDGVSFSREEEYEEDDEEYEEEGPERGFFSRLLFGQGMTKRL